MWLLTINFYFILIIYCYKIPIPRTKRSAESNDSKSEQPNIILITSAELGWDDISQHGSPLALTPNLHTLSKHGLHFSNHYISPWDFSTKVELFTGEYASHHGLQHGNVTNDQPIGLDLKTRILPEYLKELGYTTKLVGKWGLGFYNNQMIPTKRGYDYFKGSLGFDSIDYYNFTSKSKYKGYDFYINNQVFYPKEPIHLTELITDAAVEIILNHTKNKSPLFLHVSYQSPQMSSITNSPQAPTKWMEPFKDIFNDTYRIGHAAMVLSLDVAVGKVMDALTEANIFDNTFILFLTTSTSPSCTVSHGVGCNYPLKGGKGTYWEGGLRSMALVFSNEIKTPGKTVKDTIHVTDWLPTLLSIASKNKLSKFNQFHGFDLSSVISNGEKSHREFILHGYDPLANNSGAIRLKDYKLVINQPIDHRSDWTKYFSYNRNKTNDLFVPGFRPASNVKPDVDSIILCDSGFPHPYLRLRAPPCIPSSKPCLFNILWDPCEYHNLAEFLPKTTSYLFEHTKMIINSGYIKKPIFPDSDSQSNPINFNNVWTPWINKIQLNNTNIINDNSTKFSDEDKILVLENTNYNIPSNNGKINSTYNVGGVSNSTLTNRNASGESKDMIAPGYESNINVDNFPYQLVNEDEIDHFDKNNYNNINEKYDSEKILKISCEELDFYNYTIECVSTASKIGTSLEAINNTNGFTPFNSTTLKDENDEETYNKIGIQMKNITHYFTSNYNGKQQANNSNLDNSSIVISPPISISPDNEPHHQPPANNIIQIFNSSNNKDKNSDNAAIKNLSIISLQNDTENSTKKLATDVPVSIERFNLEAKPERALNGNETTEKVQSTTEIIGTTPSISNVTHIIGQENETDINDKLKQKLESSFKIAKAEGSTKVLGPYNVNNSSFNLTTNAIAGNETDRKNKHYPYNVNEEENNPNINWHLTSKAKSIDYSPNVTHDNFTHLIIPYWSNFSNFNSSHGIFSNFSDFSPQSRGIINENVTVDSDVKAVANANTGETTNINSLTLNKGKNINSTVLNNVLEPIFDPIKNLTHNIKNSSSQKSLIKDGDSFRLLEVINEPLNQNQSLWKTDCECDNNVDSSSCDKCLPKSAKDKSYTENGPSSLLDSSKVTENQNIADTNSLLGHKIDGIPFTGQIEMSNKKFNVEGTVTENSAEKTESNNDYSITSNNDNIIGMSLLKNGGYDPKEKNLNQPLEIMESSANLKLTPTTIDNTYGKKNNTHVVRTKKGMIEVVGDLGDSFNENLSQSNQHEAVNATINNNAFNSVITNLEKILTSRVAGENITLNNIKNTIQSSMSDVLKSTNQNALLGNYSTESGKNITLSSNSTSNPINFTNNASVIHDYEYKKDFTDSKQFAQSNDTKKDNIYLNSGLKTNHIATMIAIVLAGLIVIGMVIVAVIAVATKKITDNYMSSNPSYRKKKYHSPSSSRNSKLKEKIPFNA